MFYTYHKLRKKVVTKHSERKLFRFFSKMLNMKYIFRHVKFCSKAFNYLLSHNPKLCLGFGLYPPVLGSACQKFTNLSLKTVKTRRMSLILSLAQESQAGNLQASRYHGFTSRFLLFLVLRFNPSISAPLDRTHLMNHTIARRRN